MIRAYETWYVGELEIQTEKLMTMAVLWDYHWYFNSLRPGDAYLRQWLIIGPRKTCPLCNCKPSNALRWRHNGHESVSNHQSHDCLHNRLFRRRSKKTSKPRVTGLCAGNSPVTDEFPAQIVSNAENVSIWWRHYGNNVIFLFIGPYGTNFRKISITTQNLFFYEMQMSTKLVTTFSGYEMSSLNMSS